MESSMHDLNSSPSNHSSTQLKLGLSALNRIIKVPTHAPNLDLVLRRLIACLEAAANAYPNTHDAGKVLIDSLSMLTDGANNSLLNGIQN